MELDVFDDDAMFAREGRPTERRFAGLEGRDRDILAGNRGVEVVDEVADVRRSTDGSSIGLPAR